MAERADLVVLCHKPPQLGCSEVAPRDGRSGASAKAVVSILGGVRLEYVRAAYPGMPVFRFIPNTPVEVRRGVLGYARESGGGDAELERAVLELFGRLGQVVPVDESLMDVAMGLMSTAPAYVALVVEALVDAGIRRGMPPDQAAELVVGAVGRHGRAAARARTWTRSRCAARSPRPAA